jgi:hypothetical protein
MMIDHIDCDPAIIAGTTSVRQPEVGAQHHEDLVSGNVLLSSAAAAHAPLSGLEAWGSATVSSRVPFEACMQFSARPGEPAHGSA